MVIGSSRTKTVTPGVASPPRLPEIFLGRDEDMSALRERLGIETAGKPPDVEVQRMAALRGWPGIGKTALATMLAGDPEIATAFPDGVLWTSLGQTPKLITELAAWGRALGTEEIIRAPTVKEAIAILAACLRQRRMLLIVDDVWKAEHVIPFSQARGSDCALLLTTRETGLIDELAIPESSVYKLPPLTEERSIDLLRILAPGVVDRYPAKCLELVKSVQCLPLALHVAGRLLKAESTKSWGISELIDDLQKGEKLIQAKAPADRIDLENETIPTVAALLRMSTDMLDDEVRGYFAFLGPLVPKPATFDLKVMASIWQVDDPRPIASNLIDHGLLERAGDRYQMHALLVMHARSLLQ